MKCTCRRVTFGWIMVRGCPEHDPNCELEMIPTFPTPSTAPVRQRRRKDEEDAA